ncbi:MAG: CotH kinase family protein [Planctomycetia bacterium]|nr:CotH kinase family protein [Planctomycetia bacterium]
MSKTAPQPGHAGSLRSSGNWQHPYAQKGSGLGVGLAMLLAVCWTTPVAAQPAKDDPKYRADSKAAKASAAFFEEGLVPEIRIEITPEELKKLQANNRSYVLCTVIETLTVKGQPVETKYTKVAIKMKGAAGSFRGLNDRPALTLNMDKFHDGQSLHGLDKFHLNNSVQDGSLMCELISGHLFRQAGVPAARATHARVWLNKRDLGIYVLKEGFDATFLRQYFAKATGNLYDGGFCREIDQPLEKDHGTGPNDHSDLKALRAACAIADLTKRQAELEKVLDIDQFLSFAAMEMLTCHWDGYCRNRNNYRLYFNPANGKAIFFPHGMDQMFGDPNFPLFDAGGIVGSAVMQVPEFRQRFRKRLEQLLPLFDPEKVNPTIDAVSQRLKPVLEAMNKDQARGYLGNMQGVKDRIKNRYVSAQKTLNAYVEPIPPKFNDKGELLVTGWTEAKETADAVHERQDLPGNKKALVLKTGPGKQCIASWRREIVLPRGKYEFQALVKTVGVVASPDANQKASGAGLRLSGGIRTNALAGNEEWKLQKHEFEVTQDNQPVVLVAELRAAGGTAMFDASSLKLIRLKP